MRVQCTVYTVQPYMSCATYTSKCVCVRNEECHDDWLYNELNKQEWLGASSILS